MKKHYLIENEVAGQAHALPSIYKLLQYSEDASASGSTEYFDIKVDSLRHQTKHFIAMRFYKNIEIFKV